MKTGTHTSVIAHDFEPPAPSRAAPTQRVSRGAVLGAAAGLVLALAAIVLLSALQLDVGVTATIVATLEISLLGAAFGAFAHAMRPVRRTSRST